MKKHTKIYLQALGYDITDWIPCEICDAKAVDIHHIDARGMGGSKSADRIENLMGLCRKCHEQYGDKAHFKGMLKDIHSNYLTIRKLGL
jgi:uncharacterized protein with PIN domain